jgi:hypothetical protein
LITAFKEHASGRFEISWHRNNAIVGTEPVDADEPAETEPESEEPIADDDEAPEEESAPETPAELADPFPKGARVQLRISKKRVVLGTIDYRVDEKHWRVLFDGAAKGAGSSLYNGEALSLSDAPPPEPKGKPERKPRATPSGDRKPSKSAELDAAAARGETPTKPIMTSKANPHYQARFDKLEAMAMAGDWDGVRAYQVKGINSYAKMVKQYRDRLLMAHGMQQQRATEAA